MAESKNRVAAIFLLPVWPVALPGRSFLPYSDPYGCRIADRRLHMLPMRKPGATNLNLWTGNRIQKPEVLLKMPQNCPKCRQIYRYPKNALQKSRG